MRTLPLFVYGTLRKGLALHRMLADSIVEHVSIGDCYVYGDLHFAPLAEYPVLRRKWTAPGRGKVVGDLYVCNQDNWSFTDVVMMELAVGYSAEWLPVYDRDSGELLQQALAFTWKSHRLGAHIPSGDYAKEEAAWT